MSEQQTGLGIPALAGKSISYIDVQQWMQSMIVLRQGSVPGVLDETFVPVTEIVNASKKLGAARHINIYKTSYIARLRECMRNQFCALAFALGNDLFEAFTDHYLANYPSFSYTLNDLGARFQAYLEETRPDAGECEKESWPDFMIELAGFEYALSLIFDEHTPVEPVYATEDEADESLRINPVLHLFKHQYPVCSYYLDFSQKNEPELPFPEESFSVVLRLNYKLGLFVVRPAQYLLLSMLQNGISIAEALDALTTKYNFSQAEVIKIWPEWRKYFITSGLLVAKL